MTGGAIMQHSPVGLFLPALASVSRFSDWWRWMIQTWSRESTDTPMVEPSSQWFGSGFGQSGSTSKRGAMGPAAAAAPCDAGALAGVCAVVLGPESQAASSTLAVAMQRDAIRRVMAYPLGRPPSLRSVSKVQPRL